MLKNEQSVMTDDQIEEFIYSEIKRKGITFYDMIGGVGGVEPAPNNKKTDTHKCVRANRFSSLSEDTRMLELLADMDSTYLDHFPPFRIPLQDLFRFWWNRCVEKTLAVEMILEDVFIYFREEMRPPAEEPEQLDMSVDFEQLPLSQKDIKEAA